MSTLSIMVRAMVTAGCSPEQIAAAVEAAEAERHQEEDSKREKLRAQATDRKRAQREVAALLANSWGPMQ